MLLLVFYHWVDDGYVEVVFAGGGKDFSLLYIYHLGGETTSSSVVRDDYSHVRSLHVAQKFQKTLLHPYTNP